MSRFTVGARVRWTEEKTTGRVGTVIEVLSHAPQVDFDRYRVELDDGHVKTLSDLELSPAGTSSLMPPAEDAA